MLQQQELNPAVDGAVRFNRRRPREAVGIWADAMFAPLPPRKGQNTQRLELYAYLGGRQQLYRCRLGRRGELSLAGRKSAAANSASIKAISSSSPHSIACARRRNCSMMRGQYRQWPRCIGQSRQSPIIDSTPLPVSSTPCWPVCRRGSSQPRFSCKLSHNSKSALPLRPKRHMFPGVGSSRGLIEVCFGTVSAKHNCTAPRPPTPSCREAFFRRPTGWRRQ